jgi:KUP system potassium uptake protein
MKPRENKLFSACLGALGVVYGDIGTSPLYAIKSCFMLNGLAVNTVNVLGIISVCLWCLWMVVSFKYVYMALKVDHQGEGGTLALASLVASRSKYAPLAITLGILGAALFFGDGVITPAISVLSAVEGLSLTHSHGSYGVIPLTVLILSGLFAIQRWGTSRIGHYFGPIMLLWFTVLFGLGAYHIFKNPFILKALNPYYAWYFFKTQSWTGLSIMGCVILVVTGAEALYADLGHFGRKPIAFSWTYCIFPALAFNYLGQGALLLSHPEAIQNPFYRMVPEKGLIVVLIIATLATIIASQAVLSGIFSITYHSVLLNYLPRLKIIHTSEDSKGQIYIPAINAFVYVLTLLAIFIFQSSEKLSLAYGLCVANIMLITTILLFFYKYIDPQARRIRLLFTFLPLFVLDVVFVAANSTKFLEGGWYVLLIMAFVYACIQAWRKGSQLRNTQNIKPLMPLDIFLKGHIQAYAPRIPGTALFISHSLHTIPLALLINLKHNRYAHEKVFVISFINLSLPYASDEESLHIEQKLEGCFQVIAYTGFMQRPNLHKILAYLKAKDYLDKDEAISIFLGKQLAQKSKEKHLSGLSESLYYYLSLMDHPRAEFYTMPQDAVVELGIRYPI